MKKLLEKIHNFTCFDGYKRTVEKWEFNGQVVTFWRPKNLLTKNSSAKTEKGVKYGYDTYILYLRPAEGNTLGVNLCPYYTDSCKAACLGNTSGRMRFNRVQAYQNNKTLWYILDPKSFYNQLKKELNKAIYRADITGRKFAVRLNGITDINFNPLIRKYPDIQFYDYTKSARRAMRNSLTNYHLTFSFDGHNWLNCIEYLEQGGNVAAVFNRDKLPNTYKGYKVIDADKYDMRFLDPPGTISGLTVKGYGHDLNDPFFIK